MAQVACRKGFILCLCGAFSAPLLHDNLACHCPSNRAEHLLIHRIRSHINPKRRKVFLKQTGQKSVKEELPEQRKEPKRAIEFQLKVPTYFWEQDAAGSNPVTRTTSPRTAYRSRRLFCKSHRSFILSHRLSKSNPLRWVSIWFSFLRVSSPIITRGPNTDNPNCMIQVGNVFGFIFSIENTL